MLGLDVKVRRAGAAFLVGSFIFGSAAAVAETSDQSPVPAVASRKESKKPASASEARHRDCLAFIQRHGQSCDPWEVPTCGHDIGYARPLSCVAP